MKEQMNITDVRVKRFDGRNDKMLGVASFTIDDAFLISGIKLLDGAKGRYLAFPSVKRGDGEWKDIVHPLNSELRERLVEIIFSAYDRLGD